MSMHKQPLTTLERTGLEKHRLAIGAPSQLSDCFRLGVRHAVAASSARQDELVAALQHCVDWFNAAGIDEDLPVQLQARATLNKTLGEKA